MSRIEQSAIKEIAREIALGNTCYINKRSRRITTIDHSMEDAALIAAQEQAQAELEQKISKYIKIENLSMENQLRIMEDFSEELSDKSVCKELSNALKRSNPVRNFHQIIDSDMELKQHWRNFNFSEYQRWVSNLIIEAYG